VSTPTHGQQRLARLPVLVMCRAGRLLGCRRRGSSLLLVIGLDRSPNASRSNILILLIRIALLQCHPIHSASSSPPPPPPSSTQRRRRGAERAERERLLGRGPRQRQREQRVLRDADAPTVRPIRALIVRVRAGQRLATRERLGRRLGRDGDRSGLEQRRLACCAGRVVGRGAGRTAVWIAAAAGATDATDTTDTGGTRGGRRVAGRVIAGMIYALSRRLLPGAPYAPGLSGSTEAQRSEGGRWKLDECLRCVLRSSRLAPPSG
jgi:hypothetical protein